jgi:hypothetical protein
VGPSKGCDAVVQLGLSIDLLLGVAFTVVEQARVFRLACANQGPGFVVSAFSNVF